MCHNTDVMSFKKTITFYSNKTSSYQREPRHAQMLTSY